jgi:hypothetical protein
MQNVSSPSNPICAVASVLVFTLGGLACVVWVSGVFQLGTVLVLRIKRLGREIMEHQSSQKYNERISSFPNAVHDADAPHIALVVSAQHIQ